MEKQQTEKAYTILVSDDFGNNKEKGTYEVAFRRWLVRELDAGRMSVGEAMERFNFHPVNGPVLIRRWRKKYASDIAITLLVMTEKEQQKLQALQKQLKQMEKHQEVLIKSIVNLYQD